MTGFGVINYAVLGIYLLSVLGIGIYFARRSGKDTDNFFKAGGRIPGWAAGISIFATALSAITFMSIPAKSFRTNWAFVGNNIAIMCLMPLVVIFFVPFIRKLSVTTAYEYLEHRFDLRIRLFSSILFMLFHIGRVAIIIYLPTLALTSITSINPYLLVFLIGILCVISTFLGGVEGVIWCDVVQGILLLTGAAFIVVFGIFKIDGGISTFFTTAVDFGKFFPSGTIDFSLYKETLLVTFVGGLFINLYQYIGSQDVVQRYNSTASQKETNKALYLNIYLTIYVIIVFYGMGTVLWVYYKQHAGLLPNSINIDSIVPYFIMHEMPVGIAGLIIAAIFAAAQSTISSSMNSISACFITDVKKRFRPNTSEKECVRLARTVIIIVGIIGTIIAAYLVKSNQSQLLNAYCSILGLFGGPVAGAFLLGIFTRRANGTGVFIGVLLSVVAEIILMKTGIYFMYYGICGIIVCVIGGYFFSFLFNNKKNIVGLSIYTVNKEYNPKAQG